MGCLRVAGADVSSASASNRCVPADATVICSLLSHTPLSLPCAIHTSPVVSAMDPSPTIVYDHMPITRDHTQPRLSLRWRPPRLTPRSISPPLSWVSV